MCLRVVEVMVRVLEAVDNMLHVLEVLEGMHCVPVHMLEVLDGSPFAGGAGGVRCVLLCMLEAVEGVLCLLDVLEMGAMCYCVCWRPFRLCSIRWRC